MGGKLADAGDTDDRGLVRLDLLVMGLSDLPLLVSAFKKALNTGTRMSLGAFGSPKLDEF